MKKVHSSTRRPAAKADAILAAIIKARKAGATWREIGETYPRGYRVYWKAVGATKRAQTPAAVAARKAWRTRRAASAPKAKRAAKGGAK